MMILSGVKEADFKFLLSALGVANGNLSAQAGKLEDAGYIAISKSFQCKLPRRRPDREMIFVTAATVPAR
jgi:hypothetical protein